MVKHAIECTKLQLSGPVHGLPVFGEGHEAAPCREATKFVGGGKILVEEGSWIR